MVTHNARQTDRAPFFAEIDVLAADTPTPRRLWGADVSETGIFLQTTHPYRVGDRVALRFDLDDNEVHVRAAEVMWVRPFEPISVDGRVPGVGLRFVTVDPPARAALRRLVRLENGEHRKGDTTLPDAASQAIPSQSMPATSLPPITQSMLARAGHPDVERTEEMLAMSIPPFTDPPRPDQRQASIDAVLAPPLFHAPSMSFSLPPDEPALEAEARVFNTPALDKPAAVTLGPKRASKPPSAPPASTRASDAADPFQGWSFRKAPEAVAPPAVESEPPARLGLSFDDDRPGSLLGPAVDDDSGPTELAGPGAFMRDDDDEPNMMSQAPEASQALSALPVAAERRQSRSRSPVRVLPLAAALLCSGAVLGVGVGVISKRIERKDPPASVVATASAAANNAAAPAEPTPPAMEPQAPTAPAVVRPVADMERALAPVDVVAGAIAHAPETRPPAAKTASVVSKPAPPAPATAAPAPAPKASKASSANVEVAVGEARVLKTFTLAGPHRIVVDLADATLPKGPVTTDRPGVTRVRFGAPAPGTSRVVVETEEVARQAKARVVDGKLIISFAS